MIALSVACCQPDVTRACTVCDGDAGQRVREQLVLDINGSTIVALTAPFIIVSAIVFAVHRGHGRRS
jgi:hypothetical protein